MPSSLTISVGDVTGIGPEITLKALARLWDADDARYVLLGPMAGLAALNQRLGLNLPLREESAAAPHDRLLVGSVPVSIPDPQALSPGAPEAALAAVAWLREGARRCLAGQAGGLVTAPVSKYAIIRAGQPFVGQTEFLSELAGTPRTIMMLLGADDRGRWLRVALATTHVSIRELPRQLTRERVQLAIQRAAAACADLGLPRAKVGVCGLNPHAGEGGVLGSEEATLITPAVEAARGEGIEAVGPLAADTLFHQAYRGDFDAVVAMYHDQGLGPLKLVAFDTGVNWTLGLPFVRTSPDHGTAYDIAGQGTADPGSMISAIQLAKQLSGW